MPQVRPAKKTMWLPEIARRERWATAASAGLGDVAHRGIAVAEQQRGHGVGGGDVALHEMLEHFPAEEEAHTRASAGHGLGSPFSRETIPSSRGMRTSAKTRSAASMATVDARPDSSLARIRTRSRP